MIISPLINDLFFLTYKWPFFPMHCHPAIKTDGPCPLEGKCILPPLGDSFQTERGPFLSPGFPPYDHKANGFGTMKPCSVLSPRVPALHGSQMEISPGPFLRWLEMTPLFPPFGDYAKSLFPRGGVRGPFRPPRPLLLNQ